LTLTKGYLRLYLCALFALQLITCAHLLPAARAGHTDFRTFYTTGHMLRSGDPIYDYAAETSAQSALVSPNAYALPFMFPPYAALLFVPLSLLSYHTAYVVFFALNLGLCALTLYLLRPFTSALDARWRPATTLLFLSFLPLGIALVFGQVSLLLLLLYCGCYVALENGKPALAGALLALALIKFQVALPVALLFLIWRQWRFVAGFIGAALALALVSLRITGAKVMETYVQSLFAMSQQSSSAAAQAKYAMFSAQMPNLYGFLHTIAGAASSSGSSSGGASLRTASWSLALTLLLSLLTLLWAALQRPSLPLALLAGILVSFHLYFYDLTLLLLPMSLLFNAACVLPASTAPIAPVAPFTTRHKAALTTSIFLAMATLWCSFLTFDDHFLFAIPVAALFLLSPNFFPALPSAQAIFATGTIVSE
jgi:hypothetical protein